MSVIFRVLRESDLRAIPCQSWCHPHKARAMGPLFVLAHSHTYDGEHPCYNDDNDDDDNSNDDTPHTRFIDK